MYEELTYETLLNRTLKRVPEAIDKREGSVIYDAAAPVCAELAQSYINMDSFLQEAFVSTASHPYLIMAGVEEGIPIHGATAAEVKGKFNMDIPIGSRFNLEEMNYIATMKLEDGVFLLRCETPGSAGSRTGTLIPIDYIDGLTGAEVTEVLMDGEDEEETERYRQRLLAARRKPVTSGNKYHYEQWAMEVAGAGAAQCQPVWAGPGTVRVLVTDTDMQPADEKLLQAVAEHIEDVRPVGASVTVAAPVARPIHISVKVTLAHSIYLEAVKQQFQKVVADYLADITFHKTFVSLALIGSLLMDVSGVVDYEELELNGSAANVRIEEGEIPVLGTLSLEV